MGYENGFQHSNREILKDKFGPNLIQIYQNDIKKAFMMELKMPILIIFFFATFIWLIYYIIEGNWFPIFAELFIVGMLLIISMVV